MGSVCFSVLSRAEASWLRPYWSECLKAHRLEISVLLQREGQVLRKYVSCFDLAEQKVYFGLFLGISTKVAF